MALALHVLSLFRTANHTANRFQCSAAAAAVAAQAADVGGFFPSEAESAAQAAARADLGAAAGLWGVVTATNQPPPSPPQESSARPQRGVAGHVLTETEAVGLAGALE